MCLARAMRAVRFVTDTVRLLHLHLQFCLRPQLIPHEETVIIIQKGLSQRDMNLRASSSERTFSSDFNPNREIYINYSKNYKYRIPWRLRCCLRTDGWT